MVLAAMTILVGLSLPALSPAMAALSAQDKADIQRAEAWLQSVTTFKARFLQNAASGASEGTIYLQRPGFLRLEYDDPTSILVVANGDYLIYHDKKLVQTSYVGIESSPAAVLLSKKASLSQNGFEVVSVLREMGVLEITLTKPKDASVGRISLIFTEKPFELRKWHVVDPQGQAITVSLFDIQKSMPIDRELFRFHDPNFFKDSP